MASFSPLMPTVLVVALTLLAGCTQLDEFESVDRAFVGQILGADSDDCTDLAECSFIRRGFGGETRLELHFDPDNVQSVAGTLTTSGELCGPTFDQVELIAIEPLLHDPLARYEFPGGPRVRNYMFALSPLTGPLAGRDVMAFVSLLRTGNVEVRIIAGSGQNACDPTDCLVIDAGGCDYFGVFALERM